MKKILPGLLCLFLIVISCDFSVPQSITIKGNPQFYIPIGRLSDLFGEDENVIADLQDKLKIESIREMMGSSDAGIKMYDYQGTGFENTQAYLFHYPIVEMDLDLSEYIGSAMIDTGGEKISIEIPPEIVQFGPLFNTQYPSGIFLTGEIDSFNELSALANLDARYTSNEKPLFKIDLPDMKKLLVKVEGKEFGLELENYDTSLKDSLYIKVPALGINDYIKGVEKDGKLRFISPETDFDSKDDLIKNGELEIFVKIAKACGGVIAPELVFDWASAIINTKDMTDGLNGDYNIDINLAEVLGDGMKLKKVDGYFYMGGFDKTDISMKLKFGNKTWDYAKLKAAERPDFGEDGGIISGAIPESSIGSAPIDLASVINSSGSSNLEYEIRIDQMEIKKENVNAGMKIFADFVILFSLELTIDTPSGIAGYGDYVKLNLLDGLIPEPEDGGDLLGRTEGEDDLINNIEWIQINFNNFKNDIFAADLVILVLNKDNDEIIGSITFDSTNSTNPYLKVDIEDLPDPFNPMFVVLLKKDTGKDFATVKIKHLVDNPAFDFFLTVYVQTDIDQTISL